MCSQSRMLRRDKGNSCPSHCVLDVAVIICMTPKRLSTHSKRCTCALVRALNGPCPELVWSAAYTTRHYSTLSLTDGSAPECIRYPSLKAVPSLKASGLHEVISPHRPSVRQKTAPMGAAGMPLSSKDAGLVRLFMTACFHQWGKLPSLGRLCLDEGSSAAELRGCARHIAM